MVRDVVFLGLHVSQMMGYEEIMDSYKLITYNGAKTLHISDHYGIEINKPASFIVLDAKNYYEALIRDSIVLYSFRNGKKIVSNDPSVGKLYNRKLSILIQIILKYSYSCLLVNYFFSFLS